MEGNFTTEWDSNRFRSPYPEEMLIAHVIGARLQDNPEFAMTQECFDMCDTIGVNPEYVARKAAIMAKKNPKIIKREYECNILLEIISSENGCSLAFLQERASFPVLTCIRLLVNRKKISLKNGLYFSR